MYRHRRMLRLHTPLPAKAKKIACLVLSSRMQQEYRPALLEDVEEAARGAGSADKILMAASAHIGEGFATTMPPAADRYSASFARWITERNITRRGAAHASSPR